MVAALFGCDGDKGDTGATGPQGPVGGTTPVVTTATSLTIAITGVTIASPPVVNFSVANEKGIAFVGLTGVRFTLAKLVPGSNGDPSYWQSYVNTTETVSGSGFPQPNGTVAVQATSDRTGTLVDHQDGTYTYTFATNVTNVTSPIAVSYQPTLTHRLALQVTPAGMSAINVTYDFRPSDGATSGLFTRDIVETASCNKCHGKLALHGGGRVETKYCVTCHNPGSSDAHSGNTVDFKVMVHKIHSGKNLPSVVAGGEYAIWGFNTVKVDFSDIGYPQDIRNCETCHDPANPNTPDAANHFNNPSTAACGSCHDDVNFATGANHPGGVQTDNSNCLVCHTSTAMLCGPHQNESCGIEDTHEVPEQVAGEKFDARILSATNTGPGQFPVVTYEVVDPTNSDAPYDIESASDPVWSNGAVSILLGWSTTDYENRCDPADVGTSRCQTSGTTAPASAISLNGRAASTNNNALPTKNLDGTFTVTSLKPVPADAVGSMTVGMTARAAGDLNENGVYTDAGDRIPIKSQVAFYPITDAVAVPRRDVVDIAKCDNCHHHLTLHGEARTDEPQLCVMCHNPDNTDIARRGGAVGVDGLTERPIDLKHMIHGIHSSAMRENPFVVYGFGNSVNDFSEVTFPGQLNNCLTCHKPGTYQVPLVSTALGTTVSSGTRTDPADDLNMTPTAAVCSACHDTQIAQQHMEQNGASFLTPQSSIDNGTYFETCAICHGPGRLADIDVVHDVH